VSKYVPRLADDLVADLLTTAPAFMLTGPRASGKTTTASRHVVDTVRLDRPGQAAAFQADPDAALAARSTPLLIDEWRVAPEVLGAVKRSVDADPVPGRFVITGSVRAGLDDQTWPVTGRVSQVPVWPLSTGYGTARCSGVCWTPTSPRRSAPRWRSPTRCPGCITYETGTATRTTCWWITGAGVCRPSRSRLRPRPPGPTRGRVPEGRAGLVPHTGELAYPLGDSIAAVPIAALWA
jgi:hypothetical protein